MVKKLCVQCVSLDINCAKASDGNGGSLSVDSVLGGPYCEMSDLILLVTGFCCLG